MTLQGDGLSLGLVLADTARGPLGCPFPPGGQAPVWPGPHAGFSKLGRMVVLQPELPEFIHMACHQVGRKILICVCLSFVTPLETNT